MLRCSLLPPRAHDARALGVFARALCVVVTALTLLAVAPPALAAPGSAAGPFGGPAASLVPYIIGGQQTSIEQVPWQVYVEGGPFEEHGETFTTACGGSILDATHVLTAAHCTDAEGTTEGYPADEYAVMAGNSYDDLLSPTMQIQKVTSIRRDPLYKTSPTSDDVAILTLAAPLELSAAKDAEAIATAPAGATPAPGTTLSISGYGKEQGPETAPPDGALYSATLTAISSEACLGFTGPESAVLLCAESPSSSTCQGDSGGPLTEGNPAVQVGIVDFGLRECPVGNPDVFTNIAAPEIRSFIEGSETPPVAPRPTSPAPAIKSIGSVPVDLSPLTCEAGGWNGSPSFTYTFRTGGPASRVLQSGPGNVFTPPANLVGEPFMCVVQATNSGGVATNVSVQTPALATDTTPPNVAITGLKCHLQACALSFTASDPNGVALTTASSVTYAVVTKCPRKKHKQKGRKPVKPPVCHQVRTVAIAPTALSTAGSYQAVSSGLPYGEAITFKLEAANAAGLKAAPASTHTTLRKPNPKKHKKAKHKKK